MSRECRISPNNFCYICSQYTVKNQKRVISSKTKELYQTYLEAQIDDQDKEFAPHIVCSTCVANLTTWSRNQLKKLPFYKPMVWYRQDNHFNDCYFCQTNVQGGASVKRKRIVYADVDSVQKPFKIAHHQPGFNIPNLSSSNNSSKSESKDNVCNEEGSNMANIFDKQSLDTLIERDKPFRKYFELKSSHTVCNDID